MLLKKWREILSPYSEAWEILGKLIQAFRQLKRTPRMTLANLCPVMTTIRSSLISGV